MRTLVWTAGLLLWAVAGWGQVPAPAASPAPAGQAARGQSTGGGDAAAAQASDGPVTTLTVATRVVEISAVVKGKDGAARGGMTKDDFLLKEDGKEEPIRYFSQGSDLPLTLALMVDTSGSQRSFIGDEEQASDVFFTTMLEGRQDRAMLVEVDRRVAVLRGLTSSAGALHLSLLGLGSTAETAVETRLNDAVYAVAKDVLAKETGRKAMVILSDGGENGSHKTLEEAIEQAQRGDVQIYSILYSEADLLNGLRGTAGMRQMAGADAGRQELEKLSESTGGHVFTVTPAMGLRQIFAQIGQDLRMEYEVGYTPPPDLAPNSYHKLELRAKDRKLSVQARKGFFARP